ncbi:MAG: hypothetical protein AB8B62_17185 [Roseobacter sp.]
MTAVSLVSPYAPQPVSATSDAALTGAQSNMAIKASDSSNSANLGFDHSGQGPGDGTGTGGAQLALLLERGRTEMTIQKATTGSVIEAQSDSDPATEFLERQAQRQTEARATEEARNTMRAEERAAEAKAEIDAALAEEYVMPNPLPTAPILETDEP